MKIKKIVVIALVILGVSTYFLFRSVSAPKKEQAPEDLLIGKQYSDSSLFLSAIKQTEQTPATERITGLIVPHHLLAKEMMAAAFAYAAAGEYRNIILLSPDHFQAGKSDISTTEHDFSTVFGTVATNRDIAKQLKKLSFVGDGDFFYREHGLQAQLPFIKYYFPKAKIIALTFKPTVSRTELDQVINILEQTLPPDSLIVQSTDFSHYLTPKEAFVRDSETIVAITKAAAENGQTDILALKQPDNLDSIAALYIQASLQKNFFKTQPEILEHKNSQDYTTEKISSSTSYLTAAYVKAASADSKNKPIGDAEFIFVGDIMLSRHIGEIMAKHQDYNFPFQKIKADLTGADLMFGNLESPISDGGRSAGHLYSFRADPSAVIGLKDAGFNVLSVANNHAFDYGLEAFSDTLHNLKNAGLAYTGGGKNFQEAHQGAYQEINGIKVTILAYTDLLPKSEAASENKAGFAYLDEAQMIKDIRAAKEKSDLVIVSFHWGREYETESNSRQKKIAAEAVKAGASLIIGHHPHVVQEIGEIDGVSVAYSLGNFIFDQNFSPETKKGKLLKVEVKNKKIVGLEPETIIFNNNFQPFLKK